MSEAEVRQRIVEAVRDRGYLDGWTPRQLVARNACKLIEESAETLEAVQSERWAVWSTAMQVKQLSGELFDESDYWDESGEMDVEQIRKEVADCYVVLSVLLDALESVTEAPFDVAQAALEKAEGDVDRGVR